MRDVPNLDVVRSIAVLSVVVEHTLLALKISQIGPFPIADMGVLGVFLFFVLTSLVLMWSLERKPHPLDFYIRRWFRIYPLALVVMVAALLTHAPTAGTATDFFVAAHPGFKDLLVQACLLDSALFSGARYVVTVMWSLPYEIEMYILLPIIFFFLRRNFSLWPLLLLWALVLVNARPVSGNHHNFAVAIDYFLPGVMAYVGFSRWKPRLPGWLLPVFLAGMWAVFLPYFNFHRGWIFCLIIGLALPFFRQIKSELVLAPCRQIAKYSYGIYLTHPFALVVGLYVLRAHSLWVQISVELVLLVALPVIAYHLIEHPLIRVGSRLAGRLEKNYEQREVEQYREVSVA